MINESARRDLRRFYGFVRPYRFRALAGVALTSAAGAMTGGMALLIKPYVDDVLAGDGTRESLFFPYIGEIAHSPFFYPVLVVAFSVVESLFNFGANYLTTWTGKRMAMDIKGSLFSKLVHSDPGVFDKSTSGNTLVRYGADADTASEGLLGNVKSLVTRVVMSVSLICVMFWTSWILALIAVGCLSVTLVPLARVRRKLKGYIRDTVQSGAAITTCYNEAYSGNRVVTSYNLYGYVEERTRASMKNIFRLSIKMVQRTNALSLVMHFATAIGIAATIYVSGRMMRTGSLSSGDFVACIAALLSLYTPIKKIGGNMSSIETCFMAIQRVLEILDVQPAIVSPPGAKKMDGMRRSIVYDGITFSYEPGKPVLKNVSLEIAAGTSVAFVGNSGGGKTTLVNLLPRFYDVDSGAIRVDGVDVREMDLDSLRANIAIVFQDNFLFGGSIRDNIVLNATDASDESIAAAVKAACLDEFVAALEHGLDTQIGERGVSLSGGQKQRVAIARAFLKDAPIVIMDEATSALDNQSEAVVQLAIENLMRNKTVLIIAHRLSTVINADRIVVLRDGEIAESGTHAELMARNGTYSSLYEMQLK